MSEKLSPEVAARKPKRVAVIAIHGVGHHESGATAQAVTDLLAGVEGGGKTPHQNTYTTFGLRQVQIELAPPADPARLKAEAERNKGGLSSTFEERRGAFRNLYTWSTWFHRKGELGRHAEERRAYVRTMDVATDFMEVQIDEYTGDKTENSYTTWRHDGQRLRPDGTPNKDVHVYEMYWADLARPNNSLLRFIFSFYQLLLHLTSLGRIALEQASLENIGKWDWFLYFRSYMYATRTLTLAVLPLLVLIYGVALAPLPLLIQSPDTRAIIAGGLICACGPLAVLVLSFLMKPLLGLKSWWFWLIPSVLPGAGLIWFLHANPQAAPFVLVVEWWILGAAVSFWIFLQYDKVRNGAAEVGAVFIGLVTLFFFILLCTQHSHDELALRTVSFLLIQYVFLSLRLLVLAFFLLAILAVVMESICVLRLSLQKDKEAETARARAAGRTARFAIAIPALLILLLSVFTGSAAYQFVSSRVDLYQCVVPRKISLPEPLQWMALNPPQTAELLNSIKGLDQTAPAANACPQTPLTPTQPVTAINNANLFLQGILVQCAPPGMIWSIGIAAVGFVLLILIVLPSVFYEISPQRAAVNLRSALLGNWLSGGFRHFRWTVILLWLAAFLVPLIALAAGAARYFAQPEPRGAFLLFLYELPLMREAGHKLLSFGGLLAGSAVVLAGLLVKYLSAVLDTILDVDNYLRTSPASFTPRARIVERYSALLRHIHTAREKDGSRSYEHIVIVAHSLGSLITADLLRFLHLKPEHWLTKFTFAGRQDEALPIYFFSMGCPLRQLLNRFFPHLYQWIRGVPEDTGFSFPYSEPGEPIPEGETPPTAQLGVTQWVNFYRSGDYVGRSVWINDVFTRTSGRAGDGKYPVPPTPTIYYDTSDPSQATRVDACIGLGAHTHYWDRTAPDVSAQLDKLITQ